MDSKRKYQTPSKTSNALVNKMLAHPFSCDSPFRLLPNISTPPSRFTKILNPFETHIVDRIHLPTFSPSVFAKVSTPKTEEKFKWSIDDISSLVPADIDEATVDLHVSDHDPTVELLVQEKIDTFFSDKAIAPSPLHEQCKQAPLIIASPDRPAELQKELVDGCAQTVLCLPPVLPTHIEELLKPYFTYTGDQQQNEQSSSNASLYRELFVFEETPHDSASIQSSPPLSTGLSPIQLSPIITKSKGAHFDYSSDAAKLKDCNLSPISRSACRLSFSGHMSVDASLVVPDVNTTSHHHQSVLEISSLPSVHEILNNSAINWSLEYKDVEFASPHSNPDIIDVSNSNTPHSKMFTSQRKRLSDSFKDVEMNDDDNVEIAINRRSKSRLFVDVTDAGYHTCGATLCENSTWGSSNMFASTPTKNKN